MFLQLEPGCAYRMCAYKNKKNTWSVNGRYMRSGSNDSHLKKNKWFRDECRLKISREKQRWKSTENFFDKCSPSFAMVNILMVLTHNNGF